MFTVETENIQGYVDAPKFLTERQSTYIALIADDGNRFLSYGIVEGTILFVDLEIEYIQGELSCFVNKKKEFATMRFCLMMKIQQFCFRTFLVIHFDTLFLPECVKRVSMSK